MKKYIIIAIAALAASVACTKVETAEVQKEINFEVANNIKTKAFTGSVYNNGAFGTYAWFNDTDEFMVNEQVDLTTGGVWKTVDNTYYWPKTGSISFISYSPFEGTSNTAGTTPAVTKNTITYTDVTAGATDLMYADKATCSNNVNEVTDNATPESGYSGVPTIFRHALAKLSFKVMANFTEWDDATTGSHTEWEITLNSFKIGGFNTTGDLALTLNADGKSWEKPVTTVDGVDYNVWTNVSGATTAQELVAAPITLTTSAQDLASATGFVLPQMLTAGVQTVDIDVDIKTTLANGKVINENFAKTINISEISTLKAWQMNENIVYTIKFKPTAHSTDPGVTPHDDDPEDVIIKFDPAVADWTDVSSTATIQI